MKITSKAILSFQFLKEHFKFQTVLITLLLTSTIIVNAQTTSLPTFEQTVDYIVTNTKGRVMYPGALDSYSRVRGYTLKDVKIEKNGKIIFVTEQKNDYNDFTITFNVFDLVANTQYPEGIIAKDFLVHFNGLNVSNGYGIVYATQNDALKVARAFRHLRTVCEKPKNDLFSQPAKEERKTLGKTETMTYITNIIGNLGQGTVLGSIDYYCGLQNGKLQKASNFSYEQVSHTFTSTSYTIYGTWRTYANGTSFEGISMNCHSGRVRKKDNTGFKKNITLKYDFDLSKFKSAEFKNNSELRLFFEEGAISNKTSSDNMLENVYMYSDNSEKRYTWAKYFVAINTDGISIENKQKLINAFNHLKKLMQEEKRKAQDDDPFGNN